MDLQIGFYFYLYELTISCSCTDAALGFFSVAENEVNKINLLFVK